MADFVPGYRRQAAARPGFRVVVAGHGQDVVGFSFGFFLPSDTGWWSNLTPAPAPEETLEIGSRTFAVIELAVREPWRRKGVARRMHASLLEGLGAERVTLTVRPEPEAAPARPAYESWGYRVMGRTRPWEGAPVYDLMLRDGSG
ncbi:GNAT family N-acetyltransferase [Streptomyces alkaliterrae]|uniref:GNAT family N-acetyltransferase n=1 Tax=Streptomyces alkaliterrae TaxID=2213162 RepID=UPI002B1F7CEB|nr:GNAT family N-acetyltransferase [Streptomyces alkaliterrae]